MIALPARDEIGEQEVTHPVRGDPDAKARALDAIADRVRTAVRRLGSDIIQIGAELNNAKELLDHGKFGPWLEAEFGWSERTARRFMQENLQGSATAELLEEICGLDVQGAVSSAEGCECVELPRGFGRD